MTRRRVSVIAILSILGGLLLVACAPAAAPPAPTSTASAKAAAPTSGLAPTVAAPAPTAKPEKLKMATPSTGMVELAQQVANRKGFYAQENLEVAITRIAADVSVKGMAGGEIDFNFALGSVIRAASAGVAVKGLMATIDKPYHVLVVRPEIKDGADLKGKIFGVSAPADSPSTMIAAALKHYGLDPAKDATLVTVGGNPERVTALKSGVIQATVLEPSSAIVAQNAGMKPLLKMADIMDMPLAGVGASDKMIRERPDVILRALRATVKGMKYLADPGNKEDVLAIMVSVLGVNKDDATATYPEMLRSLSSDGIPPEDSVMREVQVAVQAGSAKATTSISDVFDFSFAKKVKAGS